MPTFAGLQTPNGHLCGDVSSAMQKSIRRGLEEEALYWATELDLAGFGNYVWKRLRIIASEDIGLADSTCAVTVRALYENWTEARKNKQDMSGADCLFLVHAVILLARAPKSRIVDHALMVMYEGPREKRPVPDWALDKHTAAGKRKGRGHDHFFEEGARLANRTLEDPYEERGRAARAARGQRTPIRTGRPEELARRKKLGPYGRQP